MRRAIGCALLAAGWLVAARPAFAVIPCGEALGDLAPFDGQAKGGEENYSPDFRGLRHVEAARTYPALLKTIADYKARHEPVPGQHAGSGSGWKGDWATLVPREGLPTFGSKDKPVALEPVPSKKDKTNFMTVDGRKLYVRDPERDYGLARFVASDLNAALGLRTVAKSYFAQVNGELRLVSEETPGQRIARGGEGAALLMREVSAGRLRRESLYDAWAFEFLVGNIDATDANYHVTPDGRLEVFDHDLAFSVTLPAYDRIVLHTSFLGRSVPTHYTPGFLKELRELTPERIRERWGPYLSEHQLKGLLFRRAILLNDAERRGPAAVYQSRP